MRPQESIRSRVRQIWTCGRAGTGPAPLISCLAAALALASCMQAGDGAGLPSPSRFPEVQREHIFQTPATAPNRGLGSDCSDFGVQACASGRCLHRGIGANATYTCTQLCGPTDLCPTGWTCVQTHPSPDGMLCVPAQ